MRDQLTARLHPTTWEDLLVESFDRTDWLDTRPPWWEGGPPMLFGINIESDPNLEPGTVVIFPTDSARPGTRWVPQLTIDLEPPPAPNRLQDQARAIAAETMAATLAWLDKTPNRVPSWQERRRERDSVTYLTQMRHASTSWHREFGGYRVLTDVWAA